MHHTSPPASNERPSTSALMCRSLSTSDDGILRGVRYVGFNAPGFSMTLHMGSAAMSGGQITT